MMEEPRFAISKRWVACIDQLIKEGETPSYKAFCQAIGIKPQSLNDIKAARRAVTLDIVYDTCHTYRVSLDFLLLGTGEGLLPALAGNPGAAYQLNERTLKTTVMENAAPGLGGRVPEGHRSFPLISLEAAGAYVAGYQRADYYGGLATIELPAVLAPSQRAGILFQLADESMAPAFQPRDWVAGTLLSPPEWAQLPDDEHIIIVSRQRGLQLRRVQNLLPARGVLRCIPANAHFPVEEVGTADLLQLFRLLFRLSPQPGSLETALLEKVTRLEAATATLGQQLRRVQARLDTFAGAAAGATPE